MILLSAERKAAARIMKWQVRWTEAEFNPEAAPTVFTVVAVRFRR
jgi:hypothetical protein